MELTDLQSDARYLISPQLTSTEYGDTELNRNLNRAYRTVLGWVVPILGDWEIQGDILYRDLQDGVTDYELPSNIIRIYKAEVMYTTGGSFVPVDFLSVQANQGDVEGNATRVRDDVNNPTAEMFGNIIQLRPAPEEDVVNGFKIWAQTDFVDLSTNNNVPDLMEPIQRAISILAAIDYAVAEEMYKKSDELRKMLFGDASKPGDTGVKGMCEELYSVRLGARRDGLKARKRNYR